jgi:hypothetical protein
LEFFSLGCFGRVMYVDRGGGLDLAGFMLVVGLGGLKHSCTIVYAILHLDANVFIFGWAVRFVQFKGDNVLT